MARTVVYEDPLVAAHYADAAAAAGDRPTTRAARRDARKSAEKKAKDEEPPSSASKVALAEADTRDSYLSKLAKYVPVETITAATLVFAAFEPTGDAIRNVVIAGAICNVIYLLSVAVVSTAPKPRWFFYVLACLAFVGWAVATLDPVATKAGIEGENAETQKFAVLAVTAFIIPAVDPILNYLDVRFRSPAAAPPQ